MIHFIVHIPVFYKPIIVWYCSVKSMVDCFLHLFASKCHYPVREMTTYILCPEQTVSTHPHPQVSCPCNGFVRDFWLEVFIIRLPFRPLQFTLKHNIVVILT